MKIQDTDILWKLYKRFHHPGPVKEPKSLCPYFWKAMFGLLITVFCDLPFYLVLPSLIALMGLEFGMAVLVHENWFSAVMGMLTAITLLSALALVLIRLGMLAEKIPLSEKICNRISGIFATSLLLFIIVYITINARPKEPDWWGLFQGLLIVLGVFAAYGSIVGAYFLFQWYSEVSRFGQQVLLFLKSVKNGVCPLVTPPDSFKQEEVQ